MASEMEKDYLCSPSKSWLERYEELADMSYPRVVVEDMVEPFRPSQLVTSTPYKDSARSRLEQDGRSRSPDGTRGERHSRSRSPGGEERGVRFDISPRESRVDFEDRRSRSPLRSSANYGDNIIENSRPKSPYRETVDDIIDKLESNIKCLRMEVNSLSATKKQAEMRVAELQNDGDQLKSDLGEARAQYKDCAQEVGLIILLYEDRNANSEEEIDEQKSVIDKLRKDLMYVKEEQHAAVQEGLAYKQQSHKCQVELEGAREQEKMLTEQVEQQDTILTQLQNELRGVRDRHEETAHLLQNARRTNADLEDSLDSNQKDIKELSNKLLEKEDLVKKLRDDLEGQSKRIQVLKEDMAERDGQLHVAKMNLQQEQKQRQLHQQEISRYEETLHQMQADLERSQDNYRKAHAQLLQHEERLHDLKVQLTTVQGNHKESMEQLGDKSQQVAMLKNEIARMQQQNDAMADDLADFEQKTQRQKVELKKLQEHGRASEQELSGIEARYNELQQDAIQSQDRNRQSLQELSAKEEELVCVKVELSALQEKYKLKCCESEKIYTEVDLMRQNYQSANEEIKGLRMALEESRTNGDRLHKESELVVQNVNTWVQEQKHANEKLGNKIREQSKAIMQLTAEKEQMLEQINKYQKQNNKLKIELDERRNESERFKALQNHSSHQQLNSLQKDNVRLRSDLEREIGTRQTLELQIESKEQTINSLKTQLDAKKHLLIEHSSPIKDPERATRAAYKKVMEENGVSDPNAMDKNYWIQRVGELSIQLQQSSEYWSDKSLFVKFLGNTVNHVLSHQPDNGPATGI
ncbi:PMFBP-like protein [Mya arenaria]|uniref:PMFBP-like protein n=1 Tax=Mya arenaria TaxID=6604 RepID=A0ABY7EQA8_MYAAR|nr:PMFBP-like protein [Mya arenaria]